MKNRDAIVSIFVLQEFVNFYGVPGLETFQILLSIQVVRTSHPGGPGSIPGIGNYFMFLAAGNLSSEMFLKNCLPS